MSDVLVSISDLRVSFRTPRGRLQVVRGVDVELHGGGITGVLGESGSGKTVTLNALLRVFDRETGVIDSGSAVYRGRDLLALTEPELRGIRGRCISYVFQNPAQAMNPYLSVGRQMRLAGRVHGRHHDRETVLGTLRDVGIDHPELVHDMYPFELSGGLNQRVMVALAIVLRPEVLIADEPTSFIDATLRRRILDLFMEINTRSGTTVVIVTHDFDVARLACDRLVIMYGGLVMEEGSTPEILDDPLHPYTRALISCTESLDSNDGVLYSLPGVPLAPHEFADECPFAARCADVRDACRERIPPTVTIGSRRVRCVRYVSGANP